MLAFAWDDRLKLGVPEVDAQHKQWFALCNTFMAQCSGGRATHKAVQHALAAAVGYARKHFKAEEALMRDVGFPRSEYEWHRMTHDAFVERVSALAKHCKEGRPKVAEEMGAFMSGWLRRHILETDIKYVGFYISKNAAEFIRVGADEGAAGILNKIPLRSRRSASSHSRRIR